MVTRRFIYFTTAAKGSPGRLTPRRHRPEIPRRPTSPSSSGNFSALRPNFRIKTTSDRHPEPFVEVKRLEVKDEDFLPLLGNQYAVPNTVDSDSGPRPVDESSLSTMTMVRWIDLRCFIGPFFTRNLSLFYPKLWTKVVNIGHTVQ